LAVIILDSWEEVESECIQGYESAGYYGFLFLPFSSAFSTPTTTVLVKLEDSPPIDRAVKTIAANVENVLVVRYDSIEYALTVWRSVGYIVWIGHGGEEGIRVCGQQVGWVSFAASIKKSTSGRSILLSCFAVKALQYGDGCSRLITIGTGYVDAVLGGLLISYILTRSEGLFRQTLHRVSGLLQGDAGFLPLLLVYRGTDMGGDRLRDMVNLHGDRSLRCGERRVAGGGQGGSIRRRYNTCRSRHWDSGGGNGADNWGDDYAGCGDEDCDGVGSNLLLPHHKNPVVVSGSDRGIHGCFTDKPSQACHHLLSCGLLSVLGLGRRKRYERPRPILWVSHMALLKGRQAGL